MIPISVKLRGFMSYKDEQELDLSAAPLLVLAGRNGAGKSTVFDAITYALFSHARGDNPDLINHGSDRMEVEFVFRIDHDTYRIRRTLTRRYKRGRTQETQPEATRQVFRQTGDGGWEQESGTEREEDFNQWRERVLGISKEAFTSCVLLLQGQSENLIKAQPAKRHEILRSLLGLQRFEELHKRVDRQRQELKRKKDEREAELDALPEVTEEQVEAVQQAVETGAQELEKMKAEVARWIEVRVRAERWEALLRDRQALVDKETRGQEILGRREEIEAGLAAWQELHGIIGHLEDVLKRRLQAAKRHAEAASLATARDAAREEAAGAAAAVERLRKQAQAALAERDRLAGAIEHLVEEAGRLRAPAERWQQLQAAQKRRDEAREQLAGLPADLAEQLARTESEEAALQQKREAHPWLRQAHQKAAEREAALRMAQGAAGRAAALQPALSQAQLAAGHAEEALATAQEAAQAARDGRTAAETDHRQARAQAQAFAEAQEAICLRCRQPIDAQHRQKESEILSTRLQQAEAAAQAAARTFSEAETRRKEAAAGAEQARERLRALQTEQAGCQAKVEQAHKDARRLEQEVGEALQHVPPALLQADEAALAEQVRHLPAVEQEVKGLRQRVSDAQRIEEALRQAEAEIGRLLSHASAEELAEAARRLPVAEQERQDLQRQREAAQRQYEKQERERQEAEARLAHIREEAAQKERELAGAAAAVTTLEQELAARLGQLPTAWQERARTLDGAGLEALRNNEQELSRYQEEMAALREAEQGGLRERIADRDRQIDATPAEARRPAAEVEADLQAVQARQRDLETRVQGERAALEGLRRDLIAYQRKQVERDETAAEHAVYDLLATELGPKGLQSWLLGQAEAGILAEANNVLRGLSGGQLVLELRDGEQNGEARKALDLLVRNHATSERPMPIGLCSGSQKFRIAISLALAIGRYLTREARRLESVIIDEGFGCLDQEGRVETVEVMKALQNQLARIILVSHQDEFIESFSHGYRIELREQSSVALPLDACRQ